MSAPRDINLAINAGMKPDDIIKVKHCAGPRGGMSCLREDAGKGTRRDEAGRYAHHRQAEVKPEFPDGTRDVAAMPAAWTLETTSQIALDCLNRGSGAHVGDLAAWPSISA